VHGKIGYLREVICGAASDPVLAYGVLGARMMGRGAGAALVVVDQRYANTTVAVPISIASHQAMLEELARPLSSRTSTSDPELAREVT